MATLKERVTTLANQNGLKLTASSRVVPASQQIRFPYNGDLQKFFKTIGVFVAESHIRISGTYNTYILSDAKGNTLYYVNNINDVASGKSFKTKELTPNAFGLGGQRIGITECISKTVAIIESKYDKNIANDLTTLLRVTNETNQSTVPLPEKLTWYSASDLATISKDFGEILAAIWYANDVGANKIFFPPRATEALIDFYVEKSSKDQPVSVKSGGGGKVTIQNIIEGVTKSGIKMETVKNEYSYKVFELINKYQRSEGILEVAKYINLKGLDALCAVMNINRSALTYRAIQTFTQKYTNEQLKALLAPYHAELGTTLTDVVWERPDKNRFIISPMGERLPKQLNADSEMTKSLTRLANMISVVQVNCDVTKNEIKFQKNSFTNASFKFAWAGYAGGNKLGFTMVLK
jgi:hypothetical protein